MATTLPLEPIPRTNTRRRSQACTREACEPCRKKKAKCDGGSPCARCTSRDTECHYKTRTYKTKYSLQTELGELKEAQRQRDAVLAALAVPSQAQAILLRLQNGDTLKSIYESLQSRQFTSSPVDHFDSGSPDGSDEAPSGPLSVSPRESLASMNEQHEVPDSFAPVVSEDRPDTTHSYDTPTIPVSDPELGREFYCFGPADYTSMSMFGGMWVPVQHNQLSEDVNTQFYGNPLFTNNASTASWWEQNNAVPASSSFSSGTSTNFTPWSNPAPQTPGHTSSIYTVPSSTPSPTTTSPSLASPQTTYPNLASTATTDDSFIQPSTKKRNPENEDMIVVSSDESTIGPLASRNPRSAGECQPGERHRQASARSWQRQKQHVAALRSAENDAKALNKELHRQHSEIMHEVMALKNALMGHAECNHETISSWLRLQAANYVLEGGARGPVLRES